MPLPPPDLPPIGDVPPSVMPGGYFGSGQTPNLNITPGPANYYPNPGAGAPPDNNQQGFFGRMFSGTPAGFLYNVLTGNYQRIPAVRAFNAISHLVNPPQTWNQNAASNPGDPNAATDPNADPTNSDSGRFGPYNPSSDPGGNSTRSGNIAPPPAGYGTAANPFFGTLGNPSQSYSHPWGNSYNSGPNVYATGGAFRPVSGAPSDIRWNPNSGTSNAAVSAFSGSPDVQDWMHGMGGNNSPGVGDAGQSRFYGQAMRLNAQGGYDFANPVNGRSGVIGGPGVSGGPGGTIDAYNAYVMQQRQPFSWLTAPQGMGGQ
jgi:hypothetical protein